MNKANGTNAPKDALQGVIDLGVASVETHGPRPGFEPVGSNTPVGISEE